MEFFGQNTGVGNHSFLHGIFPTQVSNLSLLHFWQIVDCLRHQGNLVTFYSPFRFHPHFAQGSFSSVPPFQSAYHNTHIYTCVYHSHSFPFYPHNPAQCLAQMKCSMTMDELLIDRESTTVSTIHSQRWGHDADCWSSNLLSYLCLDLWSLFVQMGNRQARPGWGFLLLLLLIKEMATHSSTLAWKIPRTEEPGGLQSMGSQRVGHNWATSLLLSSWLSCHTCFSHHMWIHCDFLGHPSAQGDLKVLLPSPLSQELQEYIQSRDAGGVGLIPGRGPKIPHATSCRQKKNSFSFFKLAINKRSWAHSQQVQDGLLPETLREVLGKEVSFSCLILKYFVQKRLGGCQVAERCAGSLLTAAIEGSKPFMISYGHGPQPQHS